MTNEDVIKLFAYKHLRADLQEASKPFYDMALAIASTEDSAARTIALWKLLEAKDATVRWLAQS